MSGDERVQMDETFSTASMKGEFHASPFSNCFSYSTSSLDVLELVSLNLFKTEDITVQRVLQI